MTTLKLDKRMTCDGSPTCDTCGAPHAEGTVQMCPPPRHLAVRSFRATVVETEPLRIGDCPQLGEPNGESVGVANCSCGAVTTVFKCGRFGRCAPLASKKSTLADESIVRCAVCPENPRNRVTAAAD